MGKRVHAGQDCGSPTMAGSHIRICAKIPVSRMHSASPLWIHPSSASAARAIKVQPMILRTTNFTRAQDHRLDFDRPGGAGTAGVDPEDRKSTRLNSSHVEISYAVFCLKKKKK